jgi:hypothetical protein
MAKHALRHGAAAASVLTVFTFTGPVRADVVTSPPQHVRLGFQASFPVSDMKSGSEPCVSYSASFSGNATFAVDLGADLTFSYDRADIVPGGAVPIQVTYTPTNDPTHEVTVNATADVSLSTDVDDGCLIGFGIACGLGDVFACALVALGVAIDTFHDELNNFNVISAMGDFTAPLMGDPPINVPGTGDSATLQFVGLNLVKATPVSTLTFGPTPSGAFPGLGGAVALLSTSGATLTSPPPLIPVLEWQTSTALPVTITLPAVPGPTATLTLSPVLHWMNTTVALSIDIDLLGVLGDVFDDPGNIEVFPPGTNLGTLAGADTLICPGFPAPAQPACMTQVAAGNLPYPGFVPQPPDPLPMLPSMPPLPDFATVPFTITLDSDGDGLLDGTEIAMGLDPDDPDSDDDGYDDGVEVHAGCDALDGTEIPLQPTIYQGSQGGGSPPNAIMTYAAPANHIVHTGEDIACAPDGVCSAGFCSVGKIGDPCTGNHDCDQPPTPTTCRVVVNFNPAVPDLMLLKAEFNKVPLPFSDVFKHVGCSRKLDVMIDPSVNKNKLRLQAKGTVGGIIRKDNDDFTFRQ